MDLQALRIPLVFAILFGVGFIAQTLAIAEKKYKPFSTLLLFGVLLAIVSIFIGARPLDSGNDTGGYINAYNHLNSISNASSIGTEKFGNHEPLFWIYSSALKLLGLGPSFFLTITALIATAILIVAFQNLDRSISRPTVIWLVLLVFGTYTMVYFGNHLRASLAIPISLTAALFAAQGRLGAG